MQRQACVKAAAALCFTWHSCSTWHTIEQVMERWGFKADLLPVHPLTQIVRSDSIKTADKSWINGEPATGLKPSSVSKGSCFTPILQQAISHSLLMTWLAFMGTTPRWNQNLSSLTQRCCPDRNIVHLKAWKGPLPRSWACTHCGFWSTCLLLGWDLAGA